ncbi:MAG TPA: hypothetical protein VGN76_11740 [Gemmatimonadales bacterium]|nr:hypothetical protein [Gemmatimonadales bacterium]
MCYFLYIASPLTLSEVRSMLPPRVVADLGSFGEQQTLRTVHPDAQTVARLLIGRCSCDFIRPRLADPREDERHLRERYRRLEVPRPVVIEAIERHRRGAGVRPPIGGWPGALAGFVAEHARNAGPTLYHLQFSPQAFLSPPGNIRPVSVTEVLSSPEGWLREESPALVSR